MAIQKMTRIERLEAAFTLRETDKTPILGGWIACPEHMMEIAEATKDEFWADPYGVSIRAYDRLDTDGLIGIFVPRNSEDFRCVDHNSYIHADFGLSIEDAIARIDAMPTPEEIEGKFDLDSAYQGFRNSMLDMQKRCGDMLWMPAQWGAGAKVSWYGDFGYENFFVIVGLYPERAQKLMEVGGANGRCMCRIIARGVQEGIYPHAVLLGEDICSQRGPMISTKFMEKYYAPQLKYGLEPLLEVGCRPVWHCDGDVRPMLDFLIDSGVQGLQGFQPECGMIIDELVERRTKYGEPLVIFGPLAVTTELPKCTPEEITQKVHHAIEVCKGKASLIMFTGNTINPDVPLENIRAMYQALSYVPK
jgi:hypothetical protein